MTSDTDDEFLSASEGEYEENSGKNKRILKESFDAHNCCTQRICCDLKKEEDFPKKAPSSENEVTQNIIEEIVEPTISKESKYNGHSDVLDLLNGKIEENIGGWEEFNVEPTSGGEMNSGNNYCVTTKPDEIISNKIGSETHLSDFILLHLIMFIYLIYCILTMRQKVESNSELDIDSSAWDEWGDEKKEDVKGGWDDWSLIGDGTIKQVEQNESFYRQELSQSSLTDEGIKNATSLGSKKEKNNDSLWGWSGLVNAVVYSRILGDTFSSAIESTLGFPLPEEMAQRCVESEKKLRNQNRNGRRRMIFDNSSGQNLSDVLKELKIRQEIEQPRDVIHGIVPKVRTMRSGLSLIFLFKGVSYVLGKTPKQLFPHGGRSLVSLLQLSMIRLLSYKLYIYIYICLLCTLFSVF
uniref:Uncharacterized protein n=1 Tax=Heterorhabditis bacteriophora TaxID=37862 RepID=A0A1I7X6G8_HETBA